MMKGSTKKNPFTAWTRGFLPVRIGFTAQANRQRALLDALQRLKSARRGRARLLQRHLLRRTHLLHGLQAHANEKCWRTKAPISYFTFHRSNTIRLTSGGPMRTQNQVPCLLLSTDNLVLCTCERQQDALFL